MNDNRMKSLCACFAFAAFVGIGASAASQVLDSTSISNQLSPDAAGPVVQALSSQGALVFDRAGPIPTAFDLPSVDVSVTFDGDTHILTVEGMTALRSVAVAMQENTLTEQVFQVAGHVVLPSDPGSATRLATRRAQVVAEHLSVYYGIPPTQLIPVGYGASSLRDPSVPSSPLNTRIQFINVLSN